MNRSDDRLVGLSRVLREAAAELHRQALPPTLRDRVLAAAVPPRPAPVRRRFTPALALLPLYVIWFGYGESSKVLLIATNVAVITMLGAHQGVRGVPRVYLDAASALGADRWLQFRKVILPAALPKILTSIRVATGLAWVVTSRSSRRSRVLRQRLSIRTPRGKRSTTS